MTPINFILKKINFILEKFPNMKLKYEYNHYIHSHNIKILPSELFENNEYYELEDNIYIEFMKQFPGEMIVFFSDDSKYVFEDIVLFDNSITLKEKLATSIAVQYSYFNYTTDLFFNSNFDEKYDCIFFHKSLSFKDFFAECSSSAGNEEFALAA